MSMQRVQVGLLGLGRLGRIYARDLATGIHAVRLVAVADTNPARTKEVAGEYDVRGYVDPLALLEDTKVEAVVIATPTKTHREQIEAAASSGKPIFCEKPISLSLMEATEIKRSIDRAGVFFQMGFMRRFDRGYVEARKKIAEGVVGTPVVFKSTSRDPYLPSLEYVHPDSSGGLFVDMGVHDFDIARWLIGEIESVHSIGGTLAYPDLKQVGDIDNAIVSLTFENGSLGVVDLSRNGLYGYDISADILGTQGTLRVGYLRETPIMVLTKNNVSHDTVPFFPERFGQAYVDQLKNFAENLLNDRPPPVTIDDGIEALRIALAATQSYRRRETVVVATVTPEGAQAAPA